MTILRRVLPTLIAAAIVVSACGSTEGDLIGAVEDYNAGFLEGNEEAVLDRFSARCLDIVGEDVIRTAVSEAPDLNPGLEEVDVVVDLLIDDRAQVTSVFSDPEYNQEDEPWLLEDGEWRNDNC